MGSKQERVAGIECILAMYLLNAGSAHSNKLLRPQISELFNPKII